MSRYYDVRVKYREQFKDTKPVETKTMGYIPLSDEALSTVPTSKIVEKLKQLKDFEEKQLVTQQGLEEITRLMMDGLGSNLQMKTNVTQFTQKVQDEKRRLIDTLTTRGVSGKY